MYIYVYVHTHISIYINMYMYVSCMIQDNDITFPNPPADGVSCISVNGTINTPSNMFIAGAWDNNVSYIDIIYIYVYMYIKLCLCIHL
jgi:hypothetical protein